MFGVEDPQTEAAVRAYVKLIRASRSVLSRVERPLARFGLTATQLGVLEAVLHLGTMTQRELGRKVLTSAGNLSDVIDKLERRGLVTRLRGTQDRRQVRVELTNSGRRLISMVFPIHAADIAETMQALDAEEIRRLSDLLRKLGLATQASLAPAPSVNHLSLKSFDGERSLTEESPA